MKSSFLCKFVFGAASALGHGINHAAVKTVTTSSGPVSGHVAANASANVKEYLGIPYAKPPVGDLRFAPPAKFTGTSGINGTNFGFSCPATTAIPTGALQFLDFAFANATAAGRKFITIIGQLNDVYSEDCLTLNVWVPNGGAPKKAVLAFIYGGSFTSGSTDVSIYNGQNLAAQGDVIVVSVNYRLDIFGFPGNPSLPDLNVGLLDQRMAVEWIRDNIAGFGGDVSRITLFGQSAGSASVDYYSYAHASDPIVAGLIQQSGTINGFGLIDTAIANEAWFNVTNGLSCGSSSSKQADVLACMRAKSTDDILNMIPTKTRATTPDGNSIFSPAIDGITVFSDYPARNSARKFAKVPLLIGSNNKESILFKMVEALSDVTYRQSFWDKIELQQYTCGASKRASVNIAAGIPTWLYRYFGDFPGLQLTSESGAWHGAELPILFDSVPTGSGIPASTDKEIIFGTYMRAAWAAFANDPAKGLKALGWPQYDPSQKTLVRLALDGTIGPNLELPSLFASSC